MGLATGRLSRVGNFLSYSDILTQTKGEKQHGFGWMYFIEDPFSGVVFRHQKIRRAVPPFRGNCNDNKVPPQFML